ncbi:MAG TPA: hypothetical protein VHN39_11270 [Phenylobacterium sp.]|nr:hypothetical protein [Phenylobacterium sp.]
MIAVLAAPVAAQPKAPKTIAVAPLPPGLTDWGIPAQAGSTLNFFIPIGDALDFLALKTGN